MNITTENIDEWCFRYLEKDLNDEERTFFEDELKKNAVLAKQVSLWNKTVIYPESFTPVKYSIPTNLFRYRNQFLLVLFEFVLTSSLAIFLLYNTPKEVQTTENISSPPANVLLSSPVPARDNKDSTSIEGVESKNPVYINLLLNQQSDSVAAFQHDEIKNIEPDTVTSNTNHILSVSEERIKKDTIKITADTTALKKSTQKKSTTKHKYRGSRLIPINDDL